MRSEILGLYNNALSADARYSRLRTGSLPQLIQMHLSSKKTPFVTQLVNGSQTLQKSSKRNFYPIVHHSDVDRASKRPS